MSSLEISRRLTFFLTTLKIALEVYSFFCCEEVNEEDDKEDTKKSKTRTNETERMVEKTPLLFLSLPNNFSASACEHAFLFFPTRRTYKTEKRSSSPRKETNRDGRRRGGKVEDPDCLLLCDDSDDKNDEFCEEEKQRRFRRRRTFGRFVATTRTISTPTNNPRVLDRGVQFNEHAFGKRLEHEERDALPLELRFGDVGVTGDSSGRDIDNAEEGVFGGVERVRGERGDGVE